MALTRENLLKNGYREWPNYILAGALFGVPGDSFEDADILDLIQSWEAEPVDYMTPADQRIAAVPVFVQASQPTIDKWLWIRESDGQIVYNDGTGPVTLSPSIKVSTAWNPASVADGAMVSQSVTVAGAALGDQAVAAFSLALPAGMMLTAAVTAANTVVVTLFNKSGSVQDLAAGTLYIRTFAH